MKTEIKDVLHLYLGCQCQKMGQEDDKQLFKLTGISYDDTQNIWWAYFAGEEDCYAHIDDVFPILRKLSDMTEEERKELWRLVFSMGNGKTFNDRFKDFTGRVQFIDETTYYQVPRYIMMQGVERLAIESDGTVWADCDLHNWRHNQHEVTRWLLSKSFDLFGLIEQGLAIDKATLKA
jgi:hypothetical protein